MERIGMSDGEASRIDCSAEASFVEVKELSQSLSYSSWRQK